LLPPPSIVGHLVALVGGKSTCRRCGKRFRRRAGEHVAHLYTNLLIDFQKRLGSELKTLKVSDRADVLMAFGLKMDNAKIASVDMLMRSLAEQLDTQLCDLARGCEGRFTIHRRVKDDCEVVDIDAMVEGGKVSRRRLRIARVDHNGFTQSDLAIHQQGPVGFIAR
jgi:hypothetical protein